MRAPWFVALVVLSPVLTGAEWKKAVKDGWYGRAVDSMPASVSLDQRQAAEDEWLGKLSGEIVAWAPCLTTTEGPPRCLDHYYALRGEVAKAYARMNAARAKSGLPPRTADDARTDDSDAAFRALLASRVADHQRATEEPQTLGSMVRVAQECRVMLGVDSPGNPLLPDLQAACTDQVLPLTRDRLRAALASPQRRPYAKAAIIGALRDLGDPTFDNALVQQALEAAEASYPLVVDLEIDAGSCPEEVVQIWRQELKGVPSTGGQAVPVSITQATCGVSLSRSVREQVHIESWTERRWVEESVAVGYTVGQGDCTSWEQNFYGGTDGTYSVKTHTYCARVPVPVYDTQLVEREVPVTVSRTVNEVLLAGGFSLQATVTGVGASATVAIPGGYSDGHFQDYYIEGMASDEEMKAALLQNAWRFFAHDQARRMLWELQVAHWGGVARSLDAEGTLEAREEAAIIGLVCGRSNYSSLSWMETVNTVGVRVTRRDDDTVMNRPNGMPQRSGNLDFTL